MTTKQKKVLFGIFFLLAVLGFAYALYWVFFAPSDQPTEPTQPTDQETQQQAELPESQTQQTADQVTEEEPTPTEQPTDQEQQEEDPVSQQVSDQVDHIDLDEQGRVRFYNEEDGRFYRLVNGELEPIDDKQFFSVERTAWAPNQDKAILEYPDGNNIYYNFQTGQQETLPQHWEEFSFDSTGNEIATKNMALAPENRWLIKSNPDGSSVEKITHLGENTGDVDINWSPNGTVVGLSRTGPAEAYRQEVYPLGEENQNLQSLSVPGRGMVSQWSPAGEKLLYSVYSGRSNFKPELWIVNASPGSIGQNRTKLNVQTWADKCDFANEQYVYCGVPTSLPQGAGFEREAANDIEDNIYRINVDNGAKTQISTGDSNFTVESIQVDNQQKQLVITATNQRGLFKIDI